MSSIAFIIPSINRPSLHDTIKSIEVREGDQVLVEFDLPKSGKWGNIQRNRAITRATADYLAFIDDDDTYVQGHRAMMANAILQNPSKPILFKMRYPSGETLWKSQEVIPGNIGSPMILCPNDPTKFTRWFEWPNMADYMFVRDWKWPDIAWVDKVICNLAHN